MEHLNSWLSAPKCNIPSTLCIDSFQSFILLDECQYVLDIQTLVVLIVETKKGKLMSMDSESIATRAIDYSILYLNGDAYCKTARVFTCEMLVHGSKCPSCICYRNSSITGG